MSAITKKYVGVPYCLGSADPAVGLDCVSLMRAIARDLKQEMPDMFWAKPWRRSGAWECITLDDYPALWEQDKVRAKALLLRFVRSLGEEVPPLKAFCWDILILDPPDGERQVALHAGHNLAMAAFTDRGVDLAPIDVSFIKRAIRWLET